MNCWLQLGVAIAAEIVSVGLIVINRRLIRSLKKWSGRFDKIRLDTEALSERMRATVEDREQRLHAAYGMLISVAQGPMSADDKVAMCAAFLQDEGVSGTVEVIVEAPRPPQIH